MHTTRGSFHRRSKSTQRPRTGHRHSAPVAQLLQQYADLRAINVYAEVRGKYARPIPVLNNYNLAQKLLPQENNGVSRPSTAGSYVSVRPAVRPASKPEPESPELPKRSLPEEARKPRPTSVALSMAEEVSQKEEVLQKEEQPAEECEEVAEPEEVDEEKQSERSWVTTSSHRQYIQELEEMLRNERMRRIQAEQALSRQSSQPKPIA